MSIAEQIQHVQERLPEARVQAEVDRLAQLRQQGLYALIGVTAGLLILAGYTVKRDFWDKTPPPVYDRYQLMQNDKKQTIRLDKTNGSVELIEDGEIVGDLLPKTYVWDKLNDGSKITVKLEYHDGKAYCSIKVENVSAAIQQKVFSNVPGLRELYRLRFSTYGGTVVHEVSYYAGHGWYNTNGGVENTTSRPCSASMFRSIGSANVWMY